ncbi:MAG: hypothetical protein Q8K75_00370 [Chlamydiales bacterium]|nr:hypothetical protein [Chlamydiales bacterium]
MDSLSMQAAYTQRDVVFQEALTIKNDCLKIIDSAVQILEDKQYKPVKSDSFYKVQKKSQKHIKKDLKALKKLKAAIVKTDIHTVSQAEKIRSQVKGSVALSDKINQKEEISGHVKVLDDEVNAFKTDIALLVVKISDCASSILLTVKESRAVSLALKVLKLPGRHKENIHKLDKAMNKLQSAIPDVKKQERAVPEPILQEEYFEVPEPILPEEPAGEPVSEENQSIIDPDEDYFNTSLPEPLKNISSDAKRDLRILLNLLSVGEAHEAVSELMAVASDPDLLAGTLASLPQKIETAQRNREIAAGNDFFIKQIAPYFDLDECRDDGDCFFHGIGKGVGKDMMEVRQDLVEFMATNRQRLLNMNDDVLATMFGDEDEYDMQTFLAGQKAEDREGWGSVAHAKLISWMYGIPVVLHSHLYEHPVDFSTDMEGNSLSGAMVHLVYNGVNHWNRIVPKS